jgi:hypothetical protein
MKRYLLLTCGTLWAALLLAAPPGTRLSSPILGYVFDDHAQQLRTLMGVPGAASFGETLELPVSFTSAVVSSPARVAVGNRKDGLVDLVDWNGPEIRSMRLDTALRVNGLTAFSASGAWWVLSDGATVELWHWDGTAAHLVRRDAVSGEIVALAVRPDAFAAATRDGFLWKYAEETPQLVASGEWSALAFSGLDLVVAAAGELLRFSPEGVRLVVGALPEPAASIAVSADGHEYAAALGTGFLTVNRSGEARFTECGCQPGALDTLDGNLAVFARGAQKVLDSGEGGPRLTALPNLTAAFGGSAQ